MLRCTQLNYLGLLAACFCRCIYCSLYMYGSVELTMRTLLAVLLASFHMNRLKLHALSKVCFVRKKTELIQKTVDFVKYQTVYCCGP